jgi:hypothetical protein
VAQLNALCRILFSGKAIGSNTAKIFDNLLRKQTRGMSRKTRHEPQAAYWIGGWTFERWRGAVYPRE